MRNEKTTSSAVPPGKPPLPYATPRLSVYGSITEITRNRGSKSMLDGGMSAGMRRSAV
ncbi:MAG TPA: hypothetical protein VJL28_14950 [Gemmatimonadaceae bacterium]|nr:hypothetical protein [Gemmatimonadaceae bacterium]